MTPQFMTWVERCFGGGYVGQRVLFYEDGGWPSFRIGWRSRHGDYLVNLAALRWPA